MRRTWAAAALTALLFVLPTAAKEKEPRFKSVEVKHFDRAEGVELSPEFPDFLYAELRTELQKLGLFELVLGEGEVVDAADAERSLVVQGSLLEFKKGNVAAEVLIGFGAGMRSLRAKISVHRRNNQEAIYDQELKVRASSRWDEKLLARFLAKKIAGEIKHHVAR